MSLNNRTREQLQWAKVHAVAMCFFVIFYAFRDLNVYLWLSVNSGYVSTLLIVFIGFYFYFVKFGYEKESKLLLGYCAVLYITRLINGDIWLLNDKSRVVEAVVLLCIFETALLLDKSQRKKLLLVSCIAISVYFTVVSVVCIYGSFFSIAVNNPFCPSINLMNAQGIDRMEVFGHNPNIAAAWFFVAFWLLLYLFFSVRNIVCRVVIAGAAILNYVAMTLTYCRNTILASAVCIALLAAWFLIRCSRIKTMRMKIISFVIALCVLMPTIYVGSENIYISFIEISETVKEQKTITDESGSADPTGMAQETENESERRGFADTGRIGVYKAVLQTVILEPEKLLTGRLNNNTLTTVNSLLPADYLKSNPAGIAHTHNMFMYVLLETGIFGFLAVAAFFICVLIRMLKLYFNKKSFDKPELIPLVLLLAGLMMYNMLECSLFVYSDVRAYILMLVAGAVVAYEKECV